MDFKNIKLIDVGFLIFDGVDLFDIVGPLEVFNATRIEDIKSTPPSKIDAIYDSISFFNTKLISIVQQKFVLTGDGTKIIPDNSLDDFKNAELNFNPLIWVIPGGRGIHEVRKDKKFITWLTQAIDKSHLSLSVGTGTYAVAKTGLLDFEVVTTHWRHLKFFAEEFPHITIDVNARYVEGSKIITTGGVTCAIDGALAVLRSIVSEEVAQRVAESIAHSWLG